MLGKVEICGVNTAKLKVLSNEETIALLHREKLDCRIMVGGAVLTPEYARHIGADFYSKDAKQSVDIARQVIG